MSDITISEEYRELNEIYHRKSYGFGNSAIRFIKDILRFLNEFQCRSMLDYGCGKESLIRGMKQHFPIQYNRIKYCGYDPCISSRNKKPLESFDCVVCTDVLEHVEPEYLDVVLQEIRDKAEKAVYLNVAIRPSTDILPDGRNAHLIVQPPEWWKNKYEHIFKDFSIEERKVLTADRNYTVVLKRKIKVKPVSIACCYWVGKDRPGWENVELGIEYVNKLYRGVQRNTTIPFNFYCFTNEKGKFDKGIEVRSLNPLSWKGCLPKIYLHSPEANLKNRVLIFDLDTVIIGNIDNFLLYSGGFATRKEMGAGRKTAGDLLGFEAGETYRLWEQYKKCFSYMEQITNGDERILLTKLWGIQWFWQEEFPGQFVSYKNDILHDRNVLKNACIISMHGNPRPHECKDEFVRKHWV